MSRFLYRTGVFSSRHRRLVVGVWILLILGAVMTNRAVDAPSVDNFDVPGIESQHALDLLGERFPERSGATAMVVFHVDDGMVNDPEVAAGIADSVREIEALPSTLSVTDPLNGPGSVSSDGSTAFAAVQFDASATDLGREVLDELIATGAPAEGTGAQVEFGGELPLVLKERSTGPAEAIGVVAALVILYTMFRSVIAMVLPLATALAGMAFGLSVVGVLAAGVEIPSVAPQLATMIGLGVGIDYALFVLSRHRENLAAGVSVEQSAGRTNATAGQAVVFAGGTVVVAILGLQVAGIPFVAALGYSASVIVAVAAAVAVTLLPALLGFAGTRLAPNPRERHPDGSPKTTGWVWWARWVSHHPWRSSLGATAVLLVLAFPMFHMRLGQADAGTDPTSATHRRAYDLLAEGFGDGFNAPLLVVVDVSDAADPDATVGAITAGLAETLGVRFVSPAESNAAGDTAVVTVIPTTEPQDEATSELVHRLRNTTLPAATDGTDVETFVGGATAAFIDHSDKIAARLPWFIAAVVVVSLLLLTVVFRSLLVPVKAALLNLLSIGAAYGVVVAVFQWGWGLPLVGLDESVPINAVVPMMMFAIVFGLSMDYEVFILSRIREEYHSGKTNIDSVVTGLGATAKVITGAALIMICVFLGFIAGEDPIVKMMGLGLATAVAVDATIVRMVLVPSTMALVGDANWWIPRWLDRVLPRLDLEEVRSDAD